MNTSVLLLLLATAPPLDAVEFPAQAGTHADQGSVSSVPTGASSSLQTRRMDEMTSREVELYLQGGGDLVLIPFGPVSGHGAFIPMGIHGHWAHALAVLLAERANGLVYPPVFTCFSGATRSFRGAVSFPVTEQAQILERVVGVLQQQGFKRIVLVAGTNPEDLGGTVAARQVFDRTEKPVWLLIGERLLHDPAVHALYESYPGNFGETQIGLASLKILGRERPVPYPEWAGEKKVDTDPDQPPEIAEDVRALRTFGTVGFRYFEEANHGNHGMAGLTFDGQSDVDLAVHVLQKSADTAAPALDNLGHYADWLEKHPFQYIVPKDRLR
jgi:creatinine amidohydrolase/Fe(II)-dependent formamide hydrolase-like protein